MADNTIDTLSIDITSSSSSASRAINSLVKGLERLDSALSKYSGNTSALDSALSNLEQGFSRLNNVINSVDVGKLEKVTKSINSLSRTSNSGNGGSLTTLANGIRDVSSAATGLSNTAGLDGFAKTISTFGYKNVTNATSNMPSIANGLKSLNGITIPDFGDLSGLTNLINTVSQLGLKKGTAAAFNISPIVSGLKELYAVASQAPPDASGILNVANAFSVMGRETTMRAVQNMPALAAAFRQLVSELANVPQVDASVVSLANAMANLASNGAKVGSAARSLTGSLKEQKSAQDRVANSIRNVFSNTQKTSRAIVGFVKNLLFSRKGADQAGRSYSSLAAKVGLLYAKFWMLLRAVRVAGRIMEVASSLIEVQNVVDTTFGNMSGKLEEFSKTAIKNFGMSELSAKQFASQFQAMGVAMGITGQQVAKAQSLINTKKTAQGVSAGYNKMSNSMADMSINLTKLAGDMASFYDVEQSTVAKALQSGVMGGQTRPLRQYGLDLTQATLAEWALANGLNADIKNMTQAEKTMLRYQYVMVNSAKAQGDFVRTAGRIRAA